MATQLTKLMRRLREAGVNASFAVWSDKGKFFAAAPISGIHVKSDKSPEAAISAAVEAAILARKIPHVST